MVWDFKKRQMTKGLKEDILFCLKGYATFQQAQKPGDRYSGMSD